MSAILVVGSEGTLGRPLVRALRARGHEVYTTDVMHGPDPKHMRADVRSLRQLERVVTEFGPFDFVYHLAAEFGRLNGEDYYEQLWTTNLVGTRNLLELARRNGFQLVFTSSSEIYGERQEEWLDEDLPLGQPVYPQNDYAISKWANELQIRHFTSRHEVPVMILRLFNAYGPGERYHPYRSVVCLFVYRALTGTPFDVYQDYHRAFMYVDDAIATLANAVDAFRPGAVYNVGGREYRSVEDLAQLVLAETAADPSLVRLVGREEHNTRDKRPRISRAEADLGHRPDTTLELGVPRTVAWMRDIVGRGDSAWNA